MLVWRLNLAWKSGDPNQCLRLGNNAKTDRTLRERFRESASYGSAVMARFYGCAANSLSVWSFQRLANSKRNSKQNRNKKHAHRFRSSEKIIYLNDGTFPVA